jgi:hypothetical protein
LRIGISTTSQPIITLQRLVRKGLVDFLELGIGSVSRAREIVGAFPRSTIRTLHGIPFQDESTSGFMFNPCYRPLEASEVLEAMMARANQLGLTYEFYGVHAGLLGSISGPDDFTVSDNIEAQKGFHNLSVFRGRIPESGHTILESIYGWNRSSRAIGMTQEELEGMGQLLPLLIDLGHTAINFEIYGGLTLDGLRIADLPIAEVHVSFLDLSIPPPWDHRAFTPTGTNRRILSKLREIIGNFPEVPVVLEIAGDEKDIEHAIATIAESAH